MFFIKRDKTGAAGVEPLFIVFNLKTKEMNVWLGKFYSKQTLRQLQQIKNNQKIKDNETCYPDELFC